MGKFFRMPEVFGIGPPLVQTSKEPKKTVRIPPCTPEFPDDRVPFRPELFPDLLVILFDELPVCNEGRCPVGREEEGFLSRSVLQPVGKVQDGRAERRAVDP